MVTEREGENTQKISDVYKDKLLNFLTDAMFGSAKYQGFMDSMRQSELYDEREELLENVQFDPACSKNERRLSDLRIVEQKIAMNDRGIAQKCMTLPGYFEAYYTVRGIFDLLGYILLKEAEALYSSNQYAVDIYVTRERNNMWDDIREILQNRDPGQHP